MPRTGIEPVRTLLSTGFSCYSCFYTSRLNPEGQTQNTSKKKLQKKLQLEEAAAKAAAKKEYDARKGIVEEETVDESCLSGIPSRPYCRGRNYDPNHYGAHSTEE